MNKYERKLSICRNLYYIIHQKQFCQIGHKSYILKPIFLSGTKYISIGDQSGIWHHARIEVLDKWNGISYDPKLEIGNHFRLATPEKAIVDLLYLYPFYDSPGEMEALRLDLDLMLEDIDMEILWDYTYRIRNSQLHKRMENLVKTYHL